MSGLAVAFLVGLAAWVGVRSPCRLPSVAGAGPPAGDRGTRGPVLRRGHGGVQLRGVPLAAGVAAVCLVVWGGVHGVLALVVGCGVRAAWVARSRAALRRERARERSAAVAALRVVAGEMATGRTVREALVVAARAGAHAAVRAEMSCAVAFGQWGGDEAALLVRARAGAPWLSQLGGCLAVCAQTGAAPAPVIERLADRADQGEQHRQEVAASLAGPRVQARILAALPAAGVLLGAALGGNPLRLMGTAPGTALLLAGLGLEAAGLAWMRRLTERALAMLP